MGKVRKRTFDRPEFHSTLADSFGTEQTVKGLLVASGALVVLLSLAGFAGRYWWILDLASHFRVQYFAILIVLAAALLPGRAYRPAILFAVFAALNGALILPLYTAPTDAPPHQARVLRAMLINVHTANTNHSAVIRSVTSHDPDFVVFEEVNDRWMVGLRPLSGAYPYTIVRARNDNFGIALYSKHPFASAEIVSYGVAEVPSVLAKVELDGRAFYLLGTHALPPISSRYARLRDQQLATIADAMRRLDKPVLLLGDLNVSPWSHHFKRLLQRSGLRDGTLGKGFQPTWPANIPPLLIPIDHSLYSSGILVVNRTVGNDVGSDHYPVFVEFVLAGSDR